MNIKDITQSFYSGDYQGYPPVTITGLKPGDEARDTSNNIVYEYSGVKWMPKVVVTGFDFRLGAGSSIQEMINSSDSYIPPIIQVYPGNSLEVPEGIRSSNSDLVIKHSLGSLNLRLSGIYFDAVNSVWRESNPGDEEIFITADGDYICWLGFLDKFKYSKVNISATAKVSQNITENVIISSVQPALSLVTGLVVDSTKLLGEVAIVGGTNTSVTHSGNTITIDSIGGGVGNVISVNGGTGEVIISVNGQTSTNINLDAEDVNAVSLDGRKEVTITATSGTVTISEYGCIYKATPTATSGTAMTFAFTNPTGDLNAEFDLILTMPATGSVSFPENLTWKYGTPTLSASTEYRLHFEYIDGSWQGFNRPEMSEYAKLNADNVFVGAINTFSKVQMAGSYAQGTGHIFGAGWWSMLNGFSILGHNCTASTMMSAIGKEINVNHRPGSCAIGSGLDYTHEGVVGSLPGIAIGSYNARNNNRGTGNLQFLVGNGTDNQHRSNSLELNQAGDLWVTGSLTSAGSSTSTLTASSGTVTIPAQSGHIYNYTPVANDIINFTNPTGSYAPEFELDIRMPDPVVSFSLPIVSWKFGTPNLTTAGKIYQLKFRYNEASWATAYASIPSTVASPAEGSLKYVAGSVANTVTIQKYSSNAWTNLTGFVDIPSTVESPVEGSLKYTQGTNVVSVEKYTHWEGWTTPEMSEYAKTSDTIPRIPAQSVGWVVKDDGNRQLILYGTPGFRTLELGHQWLGWAKLYGDGVNITLRSQKLYVKKGNESVTYAEISSGGILSYSDVIATVNGGTIAMSKLATIQTAACTGMGIVQGTTTNTLTWIDPDDVVLNGALLTRYEQTDLVVADGHEPTSVTDGTIIATTNREAGTKNQYQFSGFVHTPTGITTPYYKLFTKASSGLYNNLTANLYPSTTSYSWGQIQSIVKAGTAASFFPVGTVFQIDHSEYTHINGDGIYFRVVGYDQVPAADSSLTHTMCLEMTECLFSAQFDQQKLQYALTADTVAITSKVYYTRSGTTYTALVEGRDWNPGDPVPMASWYERGNDSYNYWPRSNMRQWANSSDLAGSWYEPQSIWDQVNPLYNAKNGFMRSLDPAFKAVLVKSRLTVAKLNIEGGGYTTCDDFFFPLSNTQLFSPTPGENIQVEYYVNGGDKRKTIMDQAVYVPWWTRSAHTGNSNNVFYVTTSGSSTTNDAYNSYGVSLACIIA